MCRHERCHVASCNICVSCVKHCLIFRHIGLSQAVWAITVLFLISNVSSSIFWYLDTYKISFISSSFRSPFRMGRKNIEHILVISVYHWIKKLTQEKYENSCFNGSLQGKSSTLNHRCFQDILIRSYSQSLCGSEKFSVTSHFFRGNNFPTLSWALKNFIVY